jgi:hypothetical protein
MLTNEFLRKPINGVPFLPARGSTVAPECKAITNQYLLCFLAVGGRLNYQFLGEPNGGRKEKKPVNRCQSSANANIMFR